MVSGSVTQIALIASAAILGIAALWHFYWAVGGTRGLAVSIPERPAHAGGGPLFVPSSATTLLVATAILLVAAFYLLVAFDAFVATALDGWTTVAMALLGFVFVARSIGDFGYVGLFKQTKGTPFATADSRFYSPLCLFLGATGLLTAAARYI